MKKDVLEELKEKVKKIMNNNASLEEINEVKSFYQDLEKNDSSFSKTIKFLDLPEYIELKKKLGML